ncbi:MAG: sigma-54-dependent transcriptional regulator [Thermoguttaceae bacterium]
MASVLVIDDESSVCYSLERALASDDLRVLTVGTAGEGIDQIRRESPDAVILDIRLPDMSGLDAYGLIRQIDARLPVILITAHGSTETAIEAMKMGAFDYLLKPLAVRQLREIVGRAVRLSEMSHVPAMSDDGGESAAAGEHLVGRSPQMQDLYKSIGRIAPQDVTVLILGESGTGKELVARAIYQHSRRSRAPFLVINCAAIPESLLESELFGHERGAFTGADRRRIGKFEQSDGGTIFMDEVGDMASGPQGKLLRLLQDQQFERVGGNTTIHTDVRVIAATNQDLESLAASGRFRQDLFYRLNVLAIHVPPLRERMDDLPLLVEYFLNRTNRELDRHVQEVSPEAMRLLERHSWPGNVRELQSSIKFALIHASGDVLTPECLPASFRKPPPPTEAQPSAASSGSEAIARIVRRLLNERTPDLYHAIQVEIDRVVLEEVLQRVKGNQVEAAEILGISRTTLRAKLRATGLTIEKQVAPDSSETGEG